MYPILFHIYGFEIHSYPVVVIAGFFLAALYFIRSCGKRRLSLDLVVDHFYALLISTFVFSRLGGIAESYSLYLGDPLRIFNLFDGAYSFFAGVIGLIVAFLLIIWKKKEDIWKWMDTLARPALIFFFFLAIADFVAGKNYGTPTGLSWAVTFNIPEVRYTIPVHPVQIYEAVLVFLLSGYLWILEKKRQYDGVIASYAFLGYFSVLALLSFFRGVADTMIFNLRISLVFSLVFAAIGLILLVLRTHPHIHFLYLHDD